MVVCRQWNLLHDRVGLDLAIDLERGDVDDEHLVVLFDRGRQPLAVRREVNGASGSASRCVEPAQVHRANTARIDDIPLALALATSGAATAADARMGGEACPIQLHPSVRDAVFSSAGRLPRLEARAQLDRPASASRARIAAWRSSNCRARRITGISIILPSRANEARPAAAAAAPSSTTRVA